MVNEINRVVGELGKPRYLILGIDPGITSCGFALIDINNQEILEMGSRLFDAPIVPKTKQSKAAVRRGYRSTRRNISRTRDRLKHCLNVLKQYDVVPQDATAEYFHSIKGDKQPLQLRVDGLSRKLTNREWGLVLYSICKRRGYIPHGEGDENGSSEDGRVLKAIAQNRTLFEQSGLRTVGEWLSSLTRSRNRSGDYDKCVTHAQLSDELHLLFSAQREQGSYYAGKELERKFFEVFDWQKPRLDFDEKTYALVGSCVYFPDEKRAARCTLTSELVAAYGALGNIVIIQTDGTTRTLTAQERDEFIDVLFSPIPIKGNKECKVRYSDIRKRLDLSAREEFKGIKLEDEKKQEVYQPRGWRILRKSLSTGGEDLIKRLREDRSLADAVFEAISYSSAADTLELKLEQLALSEPEIKLLLKAPYSSQSLNGYGSRSKKALDLLLGCFEEPEILTLTDAERASGLYDLRMNPSADIEPSDKLIPYSSWLAITGGSNNNPVVLRAIAQMRKVVNSLCTEWGVPNEIHVELARELALPKKAREAIHQANRRNEKDNTRIKKQISEITGRDPDSISGSLITKWRLWEEQDNCDIYTGERIEYDRMLSDNTYTQIDHVLPFSRTGDNSKHNKVLVLAQNNQSKRNRSPYEWMKSDSENTTDWEEFTARVQENRKLHPRKKRFLLETDLVSKEGDFQSRNLVDTRYMAREVCSYLSDCLAFPNDGIKNHVIPTKGAASAWLRRAWGLNFGINGTKDRSDDRHHATDACVIAACSRSLVKKTALLSERSPYIQSQERDRMLAEAMPWPTFAYDVRAKRESVIPTKFVPRKGGGQLFEQTIYIYEGTNSQGKDLIRTKNGISKPAGNAIVSPDGKSAVKVGDMLCLRLWHDKSARKGRGQWYADPVYRADLAALKNGTYIPRIAKAHSGRKTWKPIPEHVLNYEPIVLYLEDAISIEEMVYRFDGFDMNSANWSAANIVDGSPAKIVSISKLDNLVMPKRITEDVLGRCWVPFLERRRSSDRP